MLMYFIFALTTAGALYGFYQYKCHGALWAMPVALGLGAFSSIFALFQLLVLMKTLVVLASGILMFISFLGMSYAFYQHKSKNIPWGKPAIIGLGLVTSTLFAINLMVTLTQPTKNFRSIVERERKYAEVSMEYLGNYLAKNHPNAGILLINEPKTRANEKIHEAMMNALKKGMRGKASILAEESPSEILQLKDLQKNDHSISTRYILTGKTMERLVALHPECDLVLSLMGLPMNPESLKFLSQEGDENPKLIVAFGNVAPFKNLIQRGMISAYLIHNFNQNQQSAEKKTHTLEARFNQRFCLIDKTNINKIAKEQPGLFINFPVSPDDGKNEEEVNIAKTNP